MSEPEDSRKAQQLRDEDYIFRLRRIGPQPTCPKVPDIMRLNLGLTRIGRGQHNDYFLDSAVLKNFISRSHVDIVGSKNENGKIEFVLNDRGLNGTFINDIRTTKQCTLEIGDKITFGHTNGYKILPGSHAEQPNSEFQFVFEKIPQSAKTSEIFPEGLSSDSFAREGSGDAIFDSKKEPNIDRSFLSDIQPNVQTQEISSTKAKLAAKERARHDSSSQSDNDVVAEPSSPKTRSPPTRSSRRSAVKAATSSSDNSSSAKSSGSQEGGSTSSRRKSSSTGNNASLLSETVPAVKDPTDSESDESEESKEEEEEEEEEEEKVIQKKKVPARRKKPPPAKKLPARGKKAPEPSSESESSSEEDESSKPEADQRPRSQTGRQKQTAAQQRSRKRVNPAPLPPPPPPSSSKNKRRKMGSAAGKSSDLEPGVEWYEDETCDSADCKRPKKKRTPWVQCDDCDGWYHTMCVGANYDLIKDSDAHFNCGCA